jgi:hypothetical protein
MNLRLVFGTVSVLFAVQVAAPWVQTARAQNAAPTTSASAPAPAATGQVVGPQSQPQVGVPVIVEGPKGRTHAFTDSKGVWSLYNLEPGQYRVKPAISSAADSNAAVTFTVEEPGVFGKIFGSAPKAVSTSAIMLNKDFSQ